MNTYKSKYARKALLVLARDPGRGPVPISGISQRAGNSAAMTFCVSQSAMVAAKNVSITAYGVRLVMKEVRDATAKILDTISLAAILRRVEVAGRNKPALT